MKTQVMILSVFMMFLHSGCKKNGVSDQLKGEPPVRRMVVEKMIGEIPVDGVSKLFVEKLIGVIQQKAAEAASKIDEANEKWAIPNLTSQEYYTAGKNILENAELNEEKYLTTGNVLVLLGKPSSMKVIDCSPFDIRGNINSDEERFSIFYHEDLIKINISASGFVTSILPKKNGGYAGEVPMHWPHDYSHAETLPIVSGVFDGNAAQNNLIAIAEDRIRNLFLNPESANPTNRKTGLISLEDSKLTVFLIDFLTENIATVYISLEGKNLLHGHTYWRLDDPKWKLIEETEAIHLIAGK